MTLDTYMDHEYAFFLSNELGLLFDKAGWILLIGGMILVVVALFLPITLCFNKKGLYIAVSICQILSHKLFISTFFFLKFQVYAIYNLC